MQLIHLLSLTCSGSFAICWDCSSNSQRKYVVSACLGRSRTSLKKSSIHDLRPFHAAFRVTFIFAFHSRSLRTWLSTQRFFRSYPFALSFLPWLLLQTQPPEPPLTAPADSTILPHKTCSRIPQSSISMRRRRSPTRRLPWSPMSIHTRETGMLSIVQVHANRTFISATILLNYMCLLQRRIILSLGPAYERQDKIFSMDPSDPGFVHHHNGPEAVYSQCCSTTTRLKPSA